MPEPQDPDGSQGDGSVGNSTIQAMRKQIKDLEADAKRAEAEQARAEAAEAKLAVFEKGAAFDRLNIPRTDAGLLFRDTYNGDIDDEAIKAAASKYNIVTPTPTVPQPTIPGIDQDAWRRNQQALSDTSPTQGQQSAVESINAAKTPEELNSILDTLGVRGS